MLYLDAALVAHQLAGELDHRPEIARPTMRDPILERLFARLFGATTHAVTETLALEETLLRLLAHLMGEHGSRPRRTTLATTAVRLARRRLDDAPELAVTLDELASLSGVSRYQLLRGFARQVGITPHAYQLQRRVRLARQFLATGQAPAEAALAAGFSDQSHMTRAFRRQFGVTPARYQAAIA